MYIAEQTVEGGDHNGLDIRAWDYMGGKNNSDLPQFYPKITNESETVKQITKINHNYVYLKYTMYIWHCSFQIFINHFRNLGHANWGI